MANKIMLSLFDHSGVMAEPWAEAGYECYCVDIQNDNSTANVGLGRIHKVCADIEHWIPPQGDIRFVAAFPPCTDLAVSGARWFQLKGLRALSKAIALFARSQEIVEAIGAPYLIENPVSTISTYWRKPDYTFDPCDYGDPYTKKTCLWTGNGFVMPPKTPVEPVEGSKMHLLPPSPERANLRSVTPQGFARAVFNANCIHCANLTEAG